MTDYIELIKESSSGEFLVRGKPSVKVGKHYVNLWRDDDGKYLDGLQYISEDDLLWTWGKPKQFYEDYVEGSKRLKFEVVSHRYYGDPKLSKPAELKGVKQAFSVDYIPKKARCQIFLNGDDVWVKHVDYFSASLDTEEIGAPLEVLADKYADRQRGKKFIYGDAWGAIVLRNEAWLCLRNLRYWLRKGTSTLDILNELLRQQERSHGFKPFELVSTDTERFLERVINETEANK